MSILRILKALNQSAVSDINNHMSIPPILFGDPMDINYVHLKTMPQVYKYINNSLSKKPSSAPEKRQECINEMKKWKQTSSDSNE